MALAARQGVRMLALQKCRHILIQRELVIARCKLLRQRMAAGIAHILAHIATQRALHKTTQTQAQCIAIALRNKIAAELLGIAK